MMTAQDNQPMITIVAKVGKTIGQGYAVWTAAALRDMAQKNADLTFNEETGELTAVIVATGKAVAHPLAASVSFSVVAAATEAQ